MYQRALLLFAVVMAGLGFSVRAGIPASYASPSQASGGKALILEPFQSQLYLPPNAGDAEANALKASGYDVTIRRNDEVTVQVMKTLSQYNVVYIHSHSGPFQGGDGVVATGQTQNNDPSVAPLINDGSILPVSVSTINGQQTTEHYYAITSTFIRKHLGLFPAHAIVFINGCSMLKAPVFYQALQAKNVGVMISWDNEATNFDNYLSGAAFFNLMQGGMTVADALAAELAAGYGVSKPAGQARAQLSYIGDGSITLQSANQPAPPAGTAIVPTPPATATPAAPTATPAPTATSTSIPGPPLKVTFKQRVSPGQSQVLHMTSSPDTILHIRIDFPNGDRRTGTTASDPQGVATYSYRQAPSQVAYGKVFATVAIDALKGGGATSTSVRYRIGWSRIDVTVEPRVQAVDGVVTVWVHTGAHMPVTARLRFPKKGMFQRLEGRTGPAGWVHLAYKVGHYLKQGTDHTVFVRAKVHVASKDYFGYSTFTIK